MAEMDSFSELRAKLNAARGEYQQALVAQTDLMNRIGELPHPDGSLRFHQASEALRAALARYTDALEAMMDYVLKRE